ncbi:long-chain fatty acid--CoA ligase [Haematospirillum jordaniae]|nr:long-chain fatty acid--CoA ligase [Haematospirillum jordaniae]NKD58352.1 long-chain fatty acid--CoA ligase [Haematospirillum jordaniae]NKD66479.1 long-chain fatty acid--CoA ligase [Haematospirillum jordaniae]NKD78355.1 long-chain fatty acid--CoA ligase [Haematospirillum jordaniae]NKD80419.1 long-chain fatty acid--CoA ligase [Haematospirillum jordaniae]
MAPSVPRLEDFYKTGQKNRPIRRRHLRGRAVNYETTTSLVSMFFEQAAFFGPAPFLWRVVKGSYCPISWEEAAVTVRSLAHGLTEIGIKTGDRVVLVSENRPEWCLGDLAIMAAGAISVPAYTTNTPNDHRHVLTDSGARAVIVSSGRLMRPLLHAAAHIAHPPHVILINAGDLKQNPGVSLFFWDDLIAQGTTKQHLSLPTLPQRTDTACIIYTSGTGGAPKGVMLSHASILANCRGAHDVLVKLGLGQERFLSFLPLSHAYEHSAGQFFPVSIGAQIYYAESIDALGRNMAAAKPTLMAAVPRIYEVMRTKMLRSAEKSSGIKAWLFHKTLSLGTKRYCHKARLGPVEILINVICTLLVRRKIAAGFGGHLKAFVSGGAPLNPDVGYFFTALGIRILQGYGQTEAGPLISVNTPDNPKMESVGPALNGVEAKIAEDGEICVRGEMVMQGYWNNPEATAAVIDPDGWLHTGDIGHIDPEGHIFITDRKKDIIVNSGGDNISPQRIEGFLTLEPEIAQAMVYGDKRPHLVALVVPSEELISAIAAAKGVPPDLTALTKEPEILRRISAALERVNKELSTIETVRRFVIAPEAFTIDNAMLTPTLKIRRHVILERWRATLDQLYRS